MQTNTALIPVEKLEQDSYDWYERHASRLALVEKHSYEIIFMGDSITHFWECGHGDDVWKKYYSGRDILNLGFGWDRTQNLIWRLLNGEFKGQTPGFVMLNIGTNNMTGTNNARENSPEEIAEGILKIESIIHAASPLTFMLVMGVFPREKTGSDINIRISALNKILAEKLKNIKNTRFLNISERFLKDGELDTKLYAGDMTHLCPAGYEVWASAVEDIIREHLR